MTAPDTDVVRTFIRALTPAARDHLRGISAYDQIRLINTACTRHDPTELAARVSRGITRRAPLNAAGLIRYRLERAAGEHHDDSEGATDVQGR